MREPCTPRPAHRSLGRTRWRLLLLTVPLLQVAQTGACADIAQRALLDGFFRAWTPLLDGAFADYLGTGAEETP